LTFSASKPRWSGDRIIKHLTRRFGADGLDGAVSYDAVQTQVIDRYEIEELGHWMGGAHEDPLVFSMLHVLRLRLDPRAWDQLIEGELL
jgi:hypothetical protein